MASVVPSAEVCSTGDDESCDGQGQCTGDVQWASDGGEGGSHGGLDLAVDAAQNVLLTGRMSGGMEVGGEPLASEEYQAYVVSLDAGGAMRWSVVPSGSSEGSSVAVDAQGNVFAAGSFDATMQVEDAAVSSAGATDVFVAKLDPQGRLLWLRRFGGPNPDWVGEIAVDGRGDVVVFGGFEASTDLGGLPASAVGLIDVFALKLRGADGAPAWAETFGTAGLDYALGVAAGPDGEIALAGSFDGTIDLGGGPLVGQDEDAFVALLDESGEHLWSRRLGGEGHDQARAVAIDPQGRVAVGGLFSSTLDAGSGILAAEGAFDGFVVRFDGSGGPLSSVRFGGPAAETYVSRIAVDDAGNTVAFGPFTGTASFGGAPVTSGSGVGSQWAEDLWVAKLTPEGPSAWQRTFGGPGRERAHGIAVAPTGEVLLTGDFQGTFDFASAPLVAPPGDAWGLYLAKLAP